MEVCLDQPVFHSGLRLISEYKIVITQMLVRVRLC